MSDPATRSPQPNDLRRQRIDPLNLPRLPLLQWFQVLGVCSLFAIIASAVTLFSLEGQNYFLAALSYFLAVANLSAIQTLACVIALAPGDVSSRACAVFGIAFWLALLTAASTIGVDVLLQVSSDPRSVTWNYALLNAAMVFLMPISAAPIAFFLRRFRRWRCIGGSDYWRNPPLSIAGLMGNMFILAALLAVAARLDLKGIPLIPIHWFLLSGVALSALLSITIFPWLGFCLAGRWGFGWVLLAYHIAVFIFAICYPQTTEGFEQIWFILAIILQSLGATAGSLGIVVALRRGGWRLVRARPLSEPEQARTGLARVWETVADWTTRPPKP